MTTSLLNTLLVPSLPSSFGLLPPFLDLVKRAVTFESKAVTELGGTPTADLPIQTWADGLASHYEKQRRLEILGHCRMILLSPENSKDRFQFEIEVPSDSAQAIVVPVQGDDIDSVDDGDFKDDAWGFEDEVGEERPAKAESMPMGTGEDDLKDDAWGFDDEEPVQEENLPPEPSRAVPAPADDIPSEEVDNGWGFDEDMPLEGSEPAPEPESRIEPKPTERPSDDAQVKGDSEPDPDNAWGWNDGENAEGVGEDNTWDDDPWADPPPVDESGVGKTDKVVAPVNVTSRKAATRLEKVANKGKKPVNGHTNTAPVPALVPVSPTPPPIHPSPPPPQSRDAPANHAGKQFTVPAKRPPELKTNIVAKESFTVPEKAKRLVKTVENLIDECKQFQASSLFPLSPSNPPSSSSQPGSILAQTPASLIDLYIALYPVTFGNELSASVQKRMLFSNSCLYLAHEVGQIEEALSRSGGFEGLKERLGECVRNLRVLGESWYEEAVVSVFLFA